jgi:2-(1,2-epoxy-1,2-dihydrophenyl)acetyl-CoA isomerase
MSSASDLIQVRLENRIKTITFNQPRKKNAISADMSRHFLDAILSSRDDESRVVILTGAEADFCAGADLDPSLMQGGFDVTEFLRTTYNPAVTAMRDMNKPFIAKVRGSCVGVGFNFALACDIVYASETASFSQIFTRIGLSSDGGGAYFMPERIGYHRAFELMATAAMIPAAEAAQLGIINRILPDAELDAAVDALAERLANGPFLAIQHTKANLRTGAAGTLAEALEAEAVHQGVNFRSRDFFEGVAAFLQKRKPQYKGE